MADSEARGHQWAFLLDQSAPDGPWTILSVCGQCGLVRHETVGRGHLEPHLNLTGECPGRSQ